MFYNRANDTLKINFILEGIYFFNNLRNESVILINNFTKRIKDTIQLKQDGLDKISRRSFTMYLKPYFKKCLLIIYHIFMFLKFLPFYFIQARLLKKIDLQKETISNMVIALSCKRIKCNSLNKIGIRQYLIYLTTPFSSNNQTSNYFDCISKARNILIFDPIISTPLWSQFKTISKENVFIIDINFILYMNLISVFKLNFNFISTLILINKKLKIKTFQSFASKKFFITLLLTILIKGYDDLLKQPSFNAFFLTSNSFATEVLRLYLMYCSDCNKICEILHGVPTTDYECYIKNLSELETRYKLGNKLCFVPQIPDLSLGSVINQKLYFSNNKIAINTYLNEFLIATKRNFENLKNLLMDELNGLNFINKSLDKKIIITFIGGTLATNNESFSCSKSFSIEKYILSKIINIMKDENLPFAIIYSPHPSVSEFDIKKCDFFKEQDIIVYKKTIITWLISDICFALYSSALFEAAYFGAHSFIPLGEEDNFFSLDLLKSLNYCKDPNFTLEESLKNFLLQSLSTSIDLNKIQNRIQSFPSI